MLIYVFIKSSLQPLELSMQAGWALADLRDRGCTMALARFRW